MDGPVQSLTGQGGWKRFGERDGDCGMAARGQTAGGSEIGDQ